MYRDYLSVDDDGKWREYLFIEEKENKNLETSEASCNSERNTTHSSHLLTSTLKNTTHL